MTARSPGALMLSATFHAAIIGFIVLMAMIAGGQEKVAPRVLELVAGEGDNYGATVAPKLGTPGGLKVDIPAPPTPKVIPTPAPEPEPEPTPPQPKPAPIQPEPSPVVPTPTPVPTPVPPKPVEKKTLTPKQQLLRKIWAAQDKGKKEAAKERAAEEKRMKKEDFDRQQRAKIASAKSGSSAKVPRVDGEGIAKGVIGGSAENKIGGAGGRALTASEGAVLDRYYAMLVERVKNALDKPPGLNDDLAVTVQFRISSTGRISNARVLKSSGSEEFDRAVIVAFTRVSMPDHPEKKNEELELTFRTKDVGDR